MQLVRKYWYVCALLVVTVVVAVSLTIGGWVGKQLFPPASKASQSVGAGHNKAAAIHTKTDGGKQGTPTTQNTAVASLIIPAIGVNAPIESVGVLPTGAMAVPVNNPWTGVGWYHNGPYPGEKGSAVLDGHLDRPGGAPAVFWRVHSLHVGDSLIVVHTGRKTLTFHITEMDFYTPQQAPLSRIFRNNGGTFLNLITCAGTWIPLQHETTLRLVVYATLAS